MLHIEAVGRVFIEHQLKAQVDDQQGMLDQKATQLGGVEKAFADADEEGLEVGTQRMAWPSTGTSLLLPLLDELPIQLGEEATIVLHDCIVLQQSGEDRLVKHRRRRYHELELLSEQELDKYSAKEYLPFQVKRQALFCQSSFRSSFELLATLSSEIETMNMMSRTGPEIESPEDWLLVRG